MNRLRQLWRDVRATDRRFLAAAFLVAWLLSALVLEVLGLAVEVSWPQGGHFGGPTPGPDAWFPQGGALLGLAMPGALLLGVPVAVWARGLERRFLGRVWAAMWAGALAGWANLALVWGLWVALQSIPGGGPAARDLWWDVQSVALVTMLGAPVGLACGGYVGALLGALAHWWPEKRVRRD